MTQPGQKMRALQMTRLIDAPREAVFRAWTDPAELRQWFGSRDHTTPAAEVDLRPGGAYRITMRSPEGESFIVAGIYHEVDAPRRLVFSWRWEGDGPDDIESVVTIEFHELDGRTEVRLTHEGFATDEEAAPYGAGWEGCLERLIAHFR
jgi:uncharacterized protein YndB with AHSA1/START domain